MFGVDAVLELAIGEHDLLRRSSLADCHRVVDFSHFYYLKPVAPKRCASNHRLFLHITILQVMNEL